MWLLCGSFGCWCCVVSIYWNCLPSPRANKYYNIIRSLRRLCLDNFASCCSCKEFTFSMRKGKKIVYCCKFTIRVTKKKLPRTPPTPTPIICIFVTRIIGEKILQIVMISKTAFVIRIYNIILLESYPVISPATL